MPTQRLHVQARHRDADGLVCRFSPKNEKNEVLQFSHSLLHTDAKGAASVRHPPRAARSMPRWRSSTPATPRNGRDRTGGGWPAKKRLRGGGAQPNNAAGLQGTGARRRCQALPPSRLSRVMWPSSPRLGLSLRFTAQCPLGGRVHGARTQLAKCPWSHGSRTRQCRRAYTFPRARGWLHSCRRHCRRSGSPMEPPCSDAPAIARYRCSARKAARRDKTLRGRISLGQAWPSYTISNGYMRRRYSQPAPLTRPQIADFSCRYPEIDDGSVRGQFKYGHLDD
jgi:hypothetical protein